MESGGPTRILDASGDILIQISGGTGGHSGLDDGTTPPRGGAGGRGFCGGGGGASGAGTFYDPGDFPSVGGAGGISFNLINGSNNNIFNDDGTDSNIPYAYFTNPLNRNSRNPLPGAGQPFTGSPVSVAPDGGRGGVAVYGRSRGNGGGGTNSTQGPRGGGGGGGGGDKGGSGGSGNGSAGGFGCGGGGGSGVPQIQIQQ